MISANVHFGDYGEQISVWRFDADEQVYGDNFNITLQSKDQPRVTIFMTEAQLRALSDAIEQFFNDGEKGEIVRSFKKAPVGA